MQQIGRQKQHPSLIFSKPSSICCVRLSNWHVVDLPSRKLACCGMIFGSTTGVSLPSNSLSNSLYGWHSREIGLKLLSNERSLPGFGRAITRDFCQILGVRLVSMHQLNGSSNHFLACWPKCFSFYVKMPSKPIALPLLRAAMSLENS